jgi:molybdate transport system ATP-binding protein
VSASPAEILDVRLVHRVHPALSLNVALKLGREIGVVFGPSGAGKTTLLRLVAGLARPDSGQVRLDGASLFDSAKRVDQPLRRRRIGMIFQDDCLFPHLNVAANIRFGLKGWTPKETETRVAAVAALCGVERLLDQVPATLSGGERQRVGLARALAPRPRLLLCDEPVSALDLANRQALLERLRAAWRAEAIPMLYVTHSPAEAIAMGSRLFLFEAGRIVAQGAPLDVLATSRRGAARPITWEDVRNVFAAQVVDHAPAQGATRLQLDDGPELIVPFLDQPPRTRVRVAIRADDILFARQSIAGLSARNQIPGIVERVVGHGPDAEVIVQTGGLKWIVSVVAPAVEQLELAPGAGVHLIVKARSCHFLGDTALSPPT